MDFFDDSESESKPESDYEIEDNFLILPGTKIPKWLKFHDQHFRNSISFEVGCKFSKLAVCVAFCSAQLHKVKRPFYIPAESIKCLEFEVYVSINGCKQKFNHQSTRERCEELWLFSKSLRQFYKPNLSEQNQDVVDVICEIEVCNTTNSYSLILNPNDFIKWFRVSVECICCPQKSDITYLPLPSYKNGCASSSALNDTVLLPFQPVFRTSYVSVMVCRAFSNEGDLGNSIKPTNTGFEPGLKGFLGDLNVSLSAPNNSELLALLPGPNMDHEVSNTVNDLRLLKGIHNDGCDLSLSLNDSNERESEPPLFPDLINGFDFGFAQPNLEFGSGVSSGFHLGSSSMAHASVNDDSDLNVSLSAPNNFELLALLPSPNMDHEVSNTVNDLRLLKGIHNDGCDLSLSLNDSNERESEPPLFPDLTNGFDFGFAQPNLELGSGVSSGFHLGSSSMAHASVNDDSDFNMGPPPKKARTS